MKTSAALLCLLLAMGLASADSLTNQGRVYQDVALVTGRCNAAGITFTHKSGVTRLDFMDMLEADRVRYGYDPAVYAAFKEEEQRLKALAPAPAPLPQPAVAPAAPQVGQSGEVRIVRKVVVITNAPATFRPFSTPPVTTEMPDNDKMNATRLKAIQKAMEINNNAHRNR